MADKVFRATDVKLGKLALHRTGASIQIERRYVFLDSDGNVITKLQGGRVLETIPIADLPQNVKVALQSLDTFTKNKALEYEGMI